MSDKKLNLLVVGAGAMGTNHCRAISNVPGMNLVGVIDFDLDRSSSLARRYGTNSFVSLDEAISKQLVDGVVVATTTASHLGIANRVIECGLPVLVEKPLTDDLDTTKELIEYSRIQNVAIMCGFVERFNPAVRTAMNIIDEPMKHFMSVRHSPMNPRSTASVVYDLLIHDIDVALAVHQHRSEITSIQSVNWLPRGGGTDEIVDCILKFGDGAIASLSASRQSQRKIRDVRITTETHLYDIDLLRMNLTVYKNVMQEVIESAGTSSYRAETIIDMPFVRHEGEPLMLQMQHFSKLITGDVDPEEERDSLLLPHKIAETVIQSSN